MGKKVIFVVLFFIISLTLVTSAEFDNVVDYSNDNMTATIKNWWGIEIFGIEIGESFGNATLKSHKSVDYVRPVMRGNDRVPFYYDIHFKNKYNDGLGQVYFYDMKTGNEIQKDYIFVIQSFESRWLNFTRCNTMTPDNPLPGECENVSEWLEDEIEIWTPLNASDIPKGKHTIGIMVDVEANEYVDAIWTLAGKKIKKHAAWNDTFETNLQSYWHFNESAGLIIDELGYLNLTNTAASYGATGIYQDALGYAGNAYLRETKTSTYSTFTVNIWASGSATPNSWAGLIEAPRSTLGQFNMSIRREGTDVWPQAVVYNSNIVATVIKATSINILNTDWFMYTAVKNATHLTFYVDGVSQGSGAITDDTVWTGIDIGMSANNFGRQWTGVIDEAMIWTDAKSPSIIAELYDSGTGTFRTEAAATPTITLNSPVDVYNTTDTEITFNCTGADAINLSVMDFYVDDILNQTNSTPYNNTPTLFTVSGLTIDEHNWTCEASNNNSLSTTASTRYFNISFAPKIIVTLVTPTPYYNTTNITTNYNCSGNYYLGLTNLSLIMDGVINYTVTNSTPAENLSIDVLRNVADGYHNWTCEGYNDDDGEYDIASVQYFTVTIPTGLNITLNYPNGHIINVPWVLFNWTPTDNLGFLNGTIYLNSLILTSNVQDNRQITKVGELWTDQTPASGNISAGLTLFERDGSKYIINVHHLSDNMTITNVTDPTNPVLISWLSNICYHQGTATSADTNTFFSSNYGERYFCTTNITDLNNPTLLSSMLNTTHFISMEKIYAFTKWDTDWVVTGGNACTNLINVTNVLAPVITNFYCDPTYTGFSEAVFIDDYIYVTYDDDGLVVINFTEYTNMNLISKYSIPGWHTEGILQDPNNATIIYLTSSEPGVVDIIRSYTIQDIENSLDIIDTYQNITFMNGNDNIILIDNETIMGFGSTSGSLLLLNISNPFSITSLQGYSGVDAPTDMLYDDGYVYTGQTIQNSDASLQIFDVSGTPRDSGTWSANESNQSVIVNNSVNSINVTGLVENTYLWNVLVTDSDGNTAFALSNNTFTISAIPFVNITSPLNGTLVTEFNETIILNWTATDTNLDTCWLEYMETAPGPTLLATDSFETGYDDWAINGGGVILNRTTSWSTDGSYSLEAYYPSGFGVEKEVDTNIVDYIIVDTLDPTTSSAFTYYNSTGSFGFVANRTDYLLNMSPFNRVADLTFSGNNCFPVACPQYHYIDNIRYYSYSAGTALATEFVTCSDNSTILNYPTSNPDTWNIYFYANDTFGNVNSSNITLVKSTTEPFFNTSISIGTDPIYNASESFNISWSYYTTVIDSCWYNTSESEFEFVTCALNTTNLTYPGASVANYSITFSLNDTLGNFNSSTSIVYANTVPAQVNVTDPVGTLLNPFIVTNASQNITFTYNIGTPQANKSCWFTIDGGVTNQSTECNSINWTIYPGATPFANLTLCSNDTFGNINCTSITLEALSDLPFINLTVPLHGSVVTIQPYQVNWTKNNSMLYNGCYLQHGDGVPINKSVNCSDLGTTLSFPLAADYQLLSLYANSSMGYMAVSGPINITKQVNLTTVNITAPFGILPGLFDIGSTINLTVTYNNVTVMNNCWYAYNGSNQSIACLNDTITAFAPSYGDEFIQVCANDTFSNIGCDSNTWGYQAVLLWNATNKESFTEGELMNYSAFLYSNTGFTPYLVLNGTNNLATTVSAVVDFYNLSYTAFAPAVDLDPELIPYYWDIQIGATHYSGIPRNISVYNVTMNNCSTGGNLLMNITGIFDESTRVRIPRNNLSLGFDVSIFTADHSTVVIEQHYETTAVTGFDYIAICTDLNFSLDYQVDIDIDYNGNYTYLNKRIWYMENGILPLYGRNLTDLTPQNISLYLLDPNAIAELPQSFVFRYYNENNQLVTDSIIHIYRKNIGSSLGVAEVGRTRADDNGNYPIDLSIDTEVYKQIVTIEGQIVYRTSSYSVLTCAETLNGYCVIDLGVGVRTIEPITDDWDEIDGAIYSVSTNVQARTISLEFTLDVSDASNITTLTVYRSQYNGTFIQVATDSLVGSAGTIVVTLPLVAGGNYTQMRDTYVYTIFKNQSIMGWGETTMERKAYEFFGDTFGLFLALLIIMTLGLMAASGGTLQIVFIILGLVFVSVLGLVKFGTTETSFGMLIYFIIAGGIMIWKLSARGR